MNKKTITIDLESYAQPSVLGSVTEGFSAGQMMVIAAGRQTGKSMYAKMLKTRLFDSNLCKEIMMPMLPSERPRSKYRFSRKWHTVNQSWFSEDWHERIQWCTNNFGPEPKVEDAWCRWHTFLGGINFRDEKDYNWYQLRWGDAA